MEGNTYRLDHKFERDAMCPGYFTIEVENIYHFISFVCLKLINWNLLYTD